MKIMAGITSLLIISLADATAADGNAGVAHKLFQWRPFLAPFHAVVLHFPIGFLTVAGIMEIYRAFRPSAELRRVTVLVLALGLFTGIVSALFGLMRAGGILLLQAQVKVSPVRRLIDGEHFARTARGRPPRSAIDDYVHRSPRLLVGDIDDVAGQPGFRSQGRTRRSGELDRLLLAGYSIGFGRHDHDAR